MSVKTLYILLIVNSILAAQVIISPYVVYIDQSEKFGSYIVQNESNEEYEISISFKFGYPVSDSLGKGTMKYYDEVPDSLPSLVNWIKAFPKKFILPPKEKQVIRMTVREPEGVKPGTYWGRIVTSSVPKAKPVDTKTEGITAKINFVINQVTTVLYRIEPAETGAVVENFESSIDSSGINVLCKLTRSGNTPFFGDLSFQLFDENDKLLDRKDEYITLYYDLTKNTVFKSDSLKQGLYKIDITLEHNEKDDVPQSKLNNVPTIKKTITVEIP